MSDRSLNFDDDSLKSFDAAPDPADALSAFDSATGQTVIPPGTYTGQITSGELLTTRSGKAAYRLLFAVTDPEQHVGFVLQRYFTFDTPSAANFAKAALAPLGLKTSADLKNPFPHPRTILCKLIVGLQRDDPSRNDLIRFAVVSDTPAATTSNPFAVGEQEEGDSK